MLEKISKNDWQYCVPVLACIICFFATDFLGIIDKSSVAYWSGRLFYEPYRIITSHFFHGDFNHLLANISGIIVARYFLKSLGLQSDYFFVTFIVLIIPLQSLLCWCVDILVFKNPMSLAIGFSGVLFGVDAFILMATIYGKKRFIFIGCELKKDPRLLKSISVLTCIGIVWSYLPGISLLGHMSGLLAGFLLFWV
jgi:membrane associated rhomboid family serine protease